MGVFDEACFCDLLGERLNKEWNEIIEGAKKKQKEKLEELGKKSKRGKISGHHHLKKPPYSHMRKGCLVGLVSKKP